MFQVTAVELCDLPGHSLCTLEGCLSLKHLKLTRCGIISLEHLSQCQQLQCIDVQVSKATPLQTATPAVIVNLALLCEKCWMKCAKPFNIPCMLSSQKVGLSLQIFWIESSCYWSIAIEVKERSVEISSSWYVVFSQGFYLQENLIEFVDLKDLNNLYMLNLSHNKLTSIHGLDSCTRLCWLNLAHNKLTQLGEGLCDIDLIRLNDTLWF